MPDSAQKLSEKVFGEKFSALLDIYELSNVQIARALNVDSSLISLFRTGQRLPSERSSVSIALISGYLSQQKLSSHQKDAIQDLLDLDAEPSADELKEHIGSWLSASQFSLQGASEVESFLETVDSFGSFATEGAVAPLEMIAPLAGDGNVPEVFFGNKGLQDAAVRYLFHLTQQEAPQTLYHFSDQSTEWMLGDKQFAKLWASLMVHVLAAGHALTIIHTVNRSAAELFTALEGWIPLYMIGEINPYYFRSGATGRVRACHFLADGLALISGYSAPGAEDAAWYRYDLDKRILASAKAQFDTLLDSCGKLMEIYRGHSDAERFAIHLNALWGQKGAMSILLSRPSFWTLPEHLLRMMLSKAEIDAEDSERVCALHAAQVKRLQRQLAADALEEICLVQTKEAFSESPLPVDIPPGLLDEQIIYTWEEYQAHLARVKELQSTSDTYTFSALDSSPFNNIKVYRKHGKETIVEKLSDPLAAFAFKNTHMCRGIDHFLSALQERSSKTVADLALAQSRS